MSIFKNIAYTKSEAIKLPVPNYWDWIAFCFIFSLIILLALGAKRMTVPYHLGQVIPISLSPKHLPLYALHTVMRMFIGLFFSLIFTFVFGTLAARNKKAEKIIIPAIDVLQSLPVLSFLSITVTGFIAVFKGSMLGPECAAIFAIFTAQAWNMALSFYQSMRSVPYELKEAAKVFHLSYWQRFWRVDVPFAMPGLLWNIMMSMSGSWFFVTASEAFSVANQKITVPGVGSYIATAILHSDTKAIIYAIFTMFCVILLYDQILFRPLSRWVQKFKFETEEGEEPLPTPWVMRLFRKTVLFNRLGYLFSVLGDKIINIPFLRRTPSVKDESDSKQSKLSVFNILYNVVLISVVTASAVILGYFIFNTFSFSDLARLLFLGCCTGLRVLVLIIISSLIWVPVGVWIGFRPKVASVIQPFIQFLASFPANLTFPVVAMLIVKFNLNTEIWISPLMVLGTQWYILFNVIAGAASLPKELKQAVDNFGVRGWLKWRRFVLPGIFPYFLTGAITASGGAWNASIIAEAISWGGINLRATGLGAYITDSASSGNFSKVVMGTIIMCLFVLVINRIFWRPLYNLAMEKFSLR